MVEVTDRRNPNQQSAERQNLCEVDFCLHFTSIILFSNEPVFKQSIIVIAVTAMGEAQIETGCLMSLSTSGKGLASVQSLVQVFNFEAYQSSRRLVCQICLHCKKKSLNQCSLIFICSYDEVDQYPCLSGVHNPDLQYKRDEWILNRIVRVISSNQRGLYSRETISLSLKASKRELYDGGLLTQFNNKPQCIS